MDMSLVRAENGPAVLIPADDGKGRVHDGKAQGNGRNQQGNGGRALHSPENGNGSQHIAQEQASRIPHEDGGRVEVVPDEPDDAAGQCRGDHRHRIQALLQGHHDHRHRGDGGYPGSQSVQPVDQVHHVGEADDPEYRKRNGKVIQIEVASPGIVQPFDPDPEAHRHQSGNDLPHQFHPGCQLEHIVQDPHDGNDGAAQQDPHHVTGQFHAGHGRRHEPDVNGQPAHPGHDPVMDFPCVGSVHSTDLERQFLGEGCQDPADDQRYTQCQ